jgi:hypothetical protein
MALLTARRTLAALGTLTFAVVLLSGCDDTSVLSYSNTCPHQVEFGAATMTMAERGELQVGDTYSGTLGVEQFTLETGETDSGSELAHTTLVMVTTADGRIVYLEERTGNPATVDLGGLCDQLRVDD